jgi:Bacteriophage lambda head decoration protein D
MPTTPVSTFGYGRVDPFREAEDADVRLVNLKASTTFAAGTIVGEITATPGTYGAYASTNTDGSQNPIGVLQYACATDASGNITFGSVAGSSEWGLVSKAAPIYMNGYFRCEDLVGLDANAVTKMGRLIQGTTTSGEIAIYGP